MKKNIKLRKNTRISPIFGVMEDRHWWLPKRLLAKFDKEALAAGHSSTEHLRKILMERYDVSSHT